MNKKLYVISGSSGVGKGTIIKGFLDRNPQFMLSVSCTTRAPREGEIDGINYFFLSKEEFQSCIDNDKYLPFLLSRQVKCYLLTEALLGFPLYTVCAVSSCHSPLLVAYLFVFPTKLCVCVCVCVCILSQDRNQGC